MSNKQTFLPSSLLFAYIYCMLGPVNILSLILTNPLGWGHPCPSLWAKVQTITPALPASGFEFGACLPQNPIFVFIYFKPTLSQAGRFNLPSERKSGTGFSKSRRIFQIEKKTEEVASLSQRQKPPIFLSL